MKRTLVVMACFCAMSPLVGQEHSAASDPRSAAKITYYCNRVKEDMGLCPDSSSAWKYLIVKRQELDSLLDKRKLGLDDTPADTQQRILEIRAALHVVTNRYHQLVFAENNAADRAASEATRVKNAQAAQAWLQRVNAEAARQPVADEYTRMGMGTGTHVGPARPQK